MTVLGGTPAGDGGDQSTVLHTCGIDGCNRPVFNRSGAVREPHILHRCGLHEIASYNAEELREWGEENAADMVAVARLALAEEVTR